MKAIVVDDETSALHVFLDQVVTDSKREYHFFKDNPKNILDYVRSNEVDLAFLDVNMPNINGLELARSLVKLSPAIKIAFVTGINIKMEDIDAKLKNNVVGIIYKPIDPVEFEKVLAQVNEETPTIEAKMFGTFDCFVKNHIVHFSSNKSKELFALLIVYEGKSLTMDQAITALWPDKDIDKAKILYRDAVWRLRSTLEEVGVPCVTFGRALLTLNKDYITCDYYDVVSGKKRPSEEEFLPSYDWSFPYQSQIDFLRG